VSVSVERRRKLVNGEFIEGTRGEWEQVLNPVTGEVIVGVPNGSEEDVDGAVKAAHEAFDGWFETTPMERAEMLLDLANALEENSEELARLESKNVGKPISLARDEMPFIVDKLRFSPGRVG
jgi:aminobutyraldehyde dehydrogenase